MTELVMTGIDERYLRGVPEGAQERIAAVDPGLRLVWNNKIGKFQVVYREPGLETLFYDGGFLHDWGLVATFDAPLEIDLVCTQMKMRNQFVEERLKKMGFADIEEYLDAADKVLADEDDPKSGMVDAKTKKLVGDLLDDFCATFTPHVTKVGAFGEFGNSHRFAENNRKRSLDAPSRAHSGKFRPTLLVPARRERPALIVPNDFVKKGLVE